MSFIHFSNLSDFRVYPQTFHVVEFTVLAVYPFSVLEVKQLIFMIHLKCL